MELGGNGQLQAWFKKCHTENSALEMKYRTKAATLYRENLRAAADDDLASGAAGGAGWGGGEEGGRSRSRSPERAPVSGKGKVKGKGKDRDKSKGRIFAAAERAAAESLAREVCASYCLVFCSCMRVSCQSMQQAIRGSLVEPSPAPLLLRSGQWALVSVDV